jgi:hypothetical protein
MRLLRSPDRGDQRIAREEQSEPLGSVGQEMSPGGARGFILSPFQGSFPRQFLPGVRFTSGYFLSGLRPLKIQV